MPDTNERARRYRAKADECLRLSRSETMPDSEVQYFRHLADCYSELALAQERRTTEQGR